MPAPRKHTLRLRTRSGFSLLELSIVVTILSVVSVLGLEVASSFISARAYDATQEKLADADTAIRKFYWVYGRLPCPSPLERTPAEDTYGVEDCAGGVPLSTTGGVYLGALPFRTLNLPLSASLDAYGSKINYYVPRRLSSGFSAFNMSDGSIEVRYGKLDDDCTASSVCSVLTTTGIYALVSYGADQRGAYNKDGLRPAQICAKRDEQRIDAQNCFRIDNTNNLADTGGTPITIPDNVIYASRYNSGTQNINYFDDIVIWRNKGAL